MSLIKLDDPIEFSKRSRPIRWMLTSSEIESRIERGKINTFKDYLEYIQELKESKIWIKYQIAAGGLIAFWLIVPFILPPLFPPSEESTSNPLAASVWIPNLLSLYNASKSTTDIVERLYFVFQLSVLLIGIVILFGILLTVFYSAFYILLRPYRLVSPTKYEKKLLDLLQDSQLSPEFNPNRITQSMKFKFEYVHPGLDFEDFYHAIKPIPLLYVSGLFFFRLGMIIISLQPLTSNMFTILIIPPVIMGSVCIIISLIVVIWVFKPYRSFKQNLESYYYQKINEVTNELIAEQAKVEDTTKLLTLHLEVADLRAVKARIEKMPVLPVSPVIKLYSYLAIIIPIFTLII